jgi:hypothetical protein
VKQIKDKKVISLFVCISALMLWTASSTKPGVKKTGVKVVQKTELLNNSPEPVALPETQTHPSVNPSEPSLHAQHAESGTGEMFSKDVIQKLESESTLSSVCGSLDKIDRKQNAPLGLGEWHKRFEDSVFGRSMDPTFESVKPVLRFVFKKPMLKGMTEHFPDISSGLNPVALMANRKQMELILDQSYLLMMIGRTVDLNPKLASDPQVVAYCNAIESKLNSLTEVDFDKQKEAFSDFLETVGIEQNAIGFSPEYKTALEVEMRDGSFSFNIGWLEQFLAAN